MPQWMDSPAEDRDRANMSMLWPLCLASVVTAVRAAGVQWELTWEDEFRGSVLNTTHWNVANNMTHGDKELQLYVADQVTVRDGTLVLTTTKTTAMYGTKEYHFVSGWVDTQNKVSQTFGKIEVRAKLPNPAAFGIWPAHWLMPERNAWNCWPVGGEIDIMEATGGEQNNTVYGTYHWGHNATHSVESTTCTSGCGCDTRFGHNGKFQPAVRHNFSDDFNVFSIEWDANRIKWFVNTVQYHERQRNENGTDLPIPTEAFYIILNTAIDWWNKQSGTPADVYPVEHIIDFVRFYQLKQ
eukprot:Stramenopile-MAST_4_protein_675